jgi:hypothetical protein
MQSNPMMKPIVSNNAFCIKFVVRDSSGTETSWYRDIHAYCKERQIPFVCRLFNSLDIEDDCMFIESLPAVHIYHKHDYVKTIHMKDNPLLAIQTQLQLYKDKQLLKKRSFLKRISAFIKTNIRS